MLFLVDESFLDSFKIYPDIFKKNLSSLIDAHFRLNHFVFISPRIANEIIIDSQFHLFLGDDIIQKITKIKEQCILLNSIKKAVLFHVNIYYSETKKEKITYNQSGGIISWNYLMTDDLDWVIYPSKIYGENILDACFFEKLAKLHASMKNFSGKNIKFHQEMTGGCGNVPKIIKNKTTTHDNPVCAIIVDSDNKYQKSNVHPLIKTCRRDMEYVNNPMLLHILDSREIENIIPLELITSAFDSLLPQDEKIKASISTLQEIYASHPDKYKFLDLKKGTCTTATKNENIDCHRYFQELEKEIKCNEKSHSSCFEISPKIGDTVLEIVDKFIQKIGIHKFTKLKLQTNTSEWNHLGHILISVSICNSERPL